MVSHIDKVFFDPNMKTIVWIFEKTLKVGTHPEVTTVTEKTIVKNVDEDPEQMASISVVIAQVNSYNVRKMKR